MEYASRFGLLGLGPSRIVRAEQHLTPDPCWVTNVVRSAGRLVEVGESPPSAGQKTRVDLEDPWSNQRPSWDRQYCVDGVTAEDAFAHEIGGVAWWSLYVEPLKEIPRALQDLLFTDGLEARLADTFVDLSQSEGTRAIDRQLIGWRSVSAMGALSLAVLDGGLRGWVICPDCQEPFEPTHGAQKYCSTQHQKKYWERASRAQRSEAAMSKRADGEHSIYQRGDGRWCAAIVADDPITGRRKRSVPYGRTRTEVRRKLKTASDRAEVGKPVRDAKSTVADWLSQWRSTTLAASSRKETTRELYTSLAKNHLEQDPFGVITLDKLRPSDIDRLILQLRGKDLSDATVRQVFTVLRGALDDAVRDGLIARNPAALVRRPGVTRTEARYLTPTEVKALLEASKESRYHAALSLIAATGLRRGEALALTWADIDLQNCTLTVRGTLARVGGKLTVTEPKTAKSRRTLRLSAGMVKLLKVHRARQAAEQLHAGNLWRGAGHVFTTATGGPVEPRNLYRALATAADAAELKGVGVHTLRHSAATAWLENGINLKAVSELLGHSNISITADHYGHVTEGTSQKAMDTLSQVLGL